MSGKAKEETDLAARIRDAINGLTNATVWREQCGQVRVRRGYMRLAPAGTPDIVGYLPGGRMVALEVKRPKGKERPEQLEFLTRAQQLGCLVGVVRSVEEALKLVREAA